MNERKAHDNYMHNAWLKQKSNDQENQRRRNQMLREERKNNISLNRKNNILKNIISRDFILSDLHNKNSDYNKRAMEDF